jgi:hypothetical protein
MNPQTILTATSDALLSKEIYEAYSEVENNFATQQWKTSELDAGHFVEAVRRLIELKLFGSYTPIGTTLPTFNDQELRRYENATGDETYRILIPRALFAAYTIRNKRGVGHLGLLKPSKIDAAYILHTIKWVFAEILRLNSNLNILQTSEIVDRITDRQIDIIWKHDNITRILSNTMSARDKVLILLYDHNPQIDVQLLASTKYQNPTNFKKVLKKLDSDLFIEFMPDGKCVITPLGIKAAEIILVNTVLAA